MIPTRSRDAPVDQENADLPAGRLDRISSWLETDLLAICSVLLLGLPLTIAAGGLVRATVGLVLVFFLPGYALTAAAFPRKGELEPLERLALSFGLSIATSMLLGLGLLYTPWGQKLFPILLSLALVIVAASATAYYRRRRFPTSARYGASHSRLLAELARYRWQRGPSEIGLALLAGASILLLAAVFVGAMGGSGATGGFTEFYVLGRNGKVGSYPGQIVLGQEVRVKLVVRNKEHGASGYRVRIAVDGKNVRQIGPINLPAGRTWDDTVEVLPTRAGPKQRIEFLLLRGRADIPYRFLRLWISVKPRQS